ncbi:MAG: tetratricopeptide repeat protein, partial [Verrucomicrobiales bacterium]
SKVAELETYMDALRKEGKAQEAREALLEAEELAADNVLVDEQLMELDLEKKDFASAHKRIRARIADTPDSPAGYFLEARIYAAEGKWDEAEALLKKALERDEKFGAAYNLLISIYLAADRGDDALAELERVLSRDEKNQRALMITALIYEQTQRPEEARPYYEKLLEAAPDFVPALNNLAYLLASHFDDPEKAVELATRARKLAPEAPSIADTLGWVQFQRGKYSEALKLLEESARGLPDNPEVQLHVGLARYMMGQTEAARKALEITVAAANDFPGKREGRAKLALLDGPAASGRATAADLEALRKEEPDDPLVLLALARVYRDGGEPARALEVGEELLAKNADLLPAITLLAELYDRDPETREQALTMAKKARELAPGDTRILGMVGGMAQRAGESAWAYSLLQDSVRQLPGDWRLQVDLAWAACGLGKLDETEAGMKKVVDHAATGSSEAGEAESALLMLALVRGREKLGDDTAAVVDAILEEDPDHLLALTVRARLQKKNGEDTAAAALCEKILDRFPDFTPAQRELASLYAQSDDPGQLDRAQALALKASRANPEDRELKQMLAVLEYGSKDYKAALQVLESLDKNEALDARGIYYLGMCQLELKRGALAQSTLRRALSEGLVESLAKEARAAMVRAELAR